MTSRKMFESRVLPELQPGLDFFRTAFGPIRDFDRQSIEGIRAHLDPYFEAGVAAAPRYDDIAISERTIDSTDGQGPLKLRLYHPSSKQGPLPCLYWIHGGGMVVGATRYDDPDCCHYARELNCIVVSVEYRLAPEHPYPEGVEDCYRGLKWLANEAASLGVDANRIAVGGRSGGGVLAAATVLIARDRGGPRDLLPASDLSDARRSQHHVVGRRVRERAQLGRQNEHRRLEGCARSACRDSGCSVPRGARQSR
jgi:acetyl esterase/lipase